MITIYILAYIVGMAIVWKIDENSSEFESIWNAPPHAVKQRIILSIFSWVILVPFMIMVVVAWTIDKDNI